IQFGLDFLVRSSSEINWILQRNLEFLEDYITTDHIPEDQTIAKIKEAIISTPGITMLDLIQNAEEQFTSDDIYDLIANNIIYIDLYKYLITEPESVKIYLNKEQQKSLSIIEQSSRKRNVPNTIEIKNGNSILWGDSAWTILNYDRGNKKVFLYSKSTNEHAELPIHLFESYISEGYIKAVESNNNKKSNKLNKMIAEASEKDLEEAN